MKENTFNIYVNTWEPYVKVELDSNGIKKFKGTAVDYFKQLTKNIPINYNFIDSSSYSNLLESLENDPKGLTLSSSKSKDKEKYALFTNTYSSYPIAIITYKDKKLLPSLNVLDTEIISVGNKFTAQRALEEFHPNIKLEKVKNTLEGLDLLLKDKVYGVADILPSIIHLKIKYSLNDLKISGITDEKIKLRMLVNNNSEKLHRILNKLIDSTNLEANELKSYEYINKQLSREILFNKDERIYLNENRSFNVCTKYNDYPQTDVVDGKVIGVMGDILDEISKKVQIKFKGISINSNDELINNIENNNCDILSYVLHNENTFTNMKNTSSFYSQNFLVIGKYNNESISQVKHFKNKIIYVRQLFHKRILLEKYPYLKITVETDLDKIMSSIKRNNNSFFATISSSADSHVVNYGYDEYKVISSLDKILVKSSFAVNSNLPLLNRILGKALKSIPEDSIEDIYDRYEVKRYRVTNEFNIYLILISAVALVSFFILFYLFNKIKKQNLGLSEEKTRFKSILELSTDGIFVLDIYGNAIEFSNEAQNILCYDYDSMKGLSIFDWDKYMTSEYFETLIDTLDDKNKHDFTRTLVTKKKKEFIAHVSAKIIEHQNLKYIHLSFRNISEELDYQNKVFEEREKAIYEKERAESAYKEAKNSELEALEAQEELISIKDELVKVNEKKSQFLANMSHEIRTPLNGIIGITDIILEKNNLDRYVYENLKIIQSSSNSLRDIINDILDFTKIQAGKFDINNKLFSLKILVEDIQNLYNPLCKQKDIGLNIIIDESIEDTLIGDELRIKQILSNIIGNAIKFTKEGSVTLKVSANINKNISNLKFDVIDTGIGMRENIQNSLFKEFTQGELSNTKEFKGTGLGLVISKSLVELMNGKIEFMSLENIGTTFTIKLNLEYIKDKKIHRIQNYRNIKLVESKKALVAEDVDINQIVIDKKLSSIGFEIDFANDGLEAVSLAKNNKYDIVFMDLQMPNMDGFEASKKIREFDEEIPIVALSAAVLEKDITKTSIYGMNDHIAKPIDNNDLFNVISSYFEIIENEVKKNNVKEPMLKQNNNKNLYKEIVNHLDEDIDEDTIKMILTIFKDDYINLHEKIDTLDKKSFDSYVHKLKGSAGNLGLNSIYDICKNIELDENNKELLVTKLKEEINKVIEMITTKLK